jgi:long-chain acyl-CoA synthetase
MFDKAVAVGRKRLLSQKPSLGERVLDSMLDRTIRVKMRQRFGGRLKAMVSGGAPLNPEIGRFFLSLGITLLQGYGQTEAGPVITCNPPGHIKIDTVGPPLDGVRVRIANDGEILVAGDNVMKGYWNDPEATAHALEDGWLHTGDVGEWSEGGLRLIDRARDFIVTSGGKTISPSFVENILRTSPYVAEAAVFGHGRRYLTALIEIDPDTVSDWARTHNVPYTGFTSLVRSPDVTGLIKAAIERANNELSRVEQIKDFRILPKMLDPAEEGEPVTPTRKVKRDLMYERFKTLVEEMYDDREQRLIAEGAGTMQPV